MGGTRHIEDPARIVGRYALHDRIAAGGMATVHLGRLAGEAGFARTVAIKRLHPQLVADPAFADMFAEEARVAARIRHTNVVPTLDVVRADDELLLVMEYVDGDSLSQLLRASRGRVPLSVAVAIVSEILHGLHAAHEARDENGEPLGVVHRDVSPQNALVGADGVTRLVDFGIARAVGRAGRSTADGDVKGKLAYMAPEQLKREPVTRCTDVYAAGIVLWELLTGKRLFASDSEGGTIEKILVGWVAPPSSVVRDLPPELDAIVLRALDPLPSERFATARAMAVALEDAVPRALGRDVAGWVEVTAAESLANKRALVERIERGPVPEIQAKEEDTTQAMAFVQQLHTVVMDPIRPLRAAPAPATAPRVATMLVATVAVLALGAFAVRPPATARAAIAVPTGAAVAEPSRAVVIVPPPAAPSITPTAAAPRARIAPRPPVVKRRVPCTSRVDPVTKKTTYHGDCE